MQMKQLFPLILVLVHALLFIWGVLGLVEYFFSAIPLGLQNAAFPAGVQFLHFASIFVTGLIFLFGYNTRWRHTPFAMVVMYAVLATLCFVETVDFGAFGKGLLRFVPMTLEFVTYIALSAYLLGATTMRERF